MSTNTKEYFLYKNLLNINKKVNIILLFSNLVPVAFIILKYLNLWVLDYKYCFYLLAVTLTGSLLQFFLNRIENHKVQFFSKYFGLIVFIAIVIFLGTRNLVHLTICFAFAPFLSCIYYDKKCTHVIILLDYILIIIATYIKSLTVLESITYSIPTTSLKWFFATTVGYTVEFFFLFLLCDFLNTRTNETLTHIIELNDERNEVISNLKDTQFKIIEFVSKALGSHDLFTGQHVIHTKKYVEVICHKLRDDGYYIKELTDSNIDFFVTSAFLHDIGKIHIPEGVLNKVGKFTDEEFALMKCHPEEGKKLLSYLPRIDNGYFNDLASEMAYCHHEKWDGTGYPRGLKGTEIPLCARIMAAADVLDALISKRLYKEPMTLTQAIEVFKKSSGTHFEPCIAQAVISSKELISQIDQEFKSVEAESQSKEMEWWLRYHDSKN